MQTIRKPAAWEHETLDSLMDCEAGQAYVVSQLGFNLEPVSKFRSSQSSECSYEIFSDSSLWLISGAVDEVATDAMDWVQENLQFDGRRWDDETDADGLVIDDMDRNLLTFLLEEEGAREFFVDHGGVDEEH